MAKTPGVFRVFPYERFCDGCHELFTLSADNFQTFHHFTASISGGVHWNENFAAMTAPEDHIQNAEKSYKIVSSVVSHPLLSFYKCGLAV